MISDIINDLECVKENNQQRWLSFRTGVLHSSLIGLHDLLILQADVTYISRLRNCALPNNEESVLVCDPASVSGQAATISTPVEIAAILPAQKNYYTFLHGGRYKNG